MQQSISTTEANPPTALATADGGVRGPGPERSSDGTEGTASEAARPDAAHLTPASVRLDGGVNLRGGREKAN